MQVAWIVHGCLRLRVGVPRGRLATKAEHNLYHNITHNLFHDLLLRSYLLISDTGRLRSNDSALSSSCRVVVDSVGHSLPVPVWSALLSMTSQKCTADT